MKIVLVICLRRLIAGLALRAQQLLEMLDHREEQLAQLVELGLRDLRRREWILVRLDRGADLAECLVGVAAQHLGRVELLLGLRELLLRGLHLLRIRCAAARAAAGTATRCGRCLRLRFDLFGLLRELRLLVADQLLDPSHARHVLRHGVLSLTRTLGRRELRGGVG